MAVSYLDVTKSRTNSTAYAVKDALQIVLVDDLISDLFVKTDNPFANEMIKKYEKQLLLCKVDFARFKNNLHDFFESTALYVKTHKLYKEFFDFTYFIYHTMIGKHVGEDIIVAYHDLLVQQAVYFQYAKTVYGITTSGELMLQDELEPYLDFPMIEYKDRFRKDSDFSDPQCIKFLRERYHHYGYDLDHPIDMMGIVRDEQMQTNALYQMAHFIDEQHMDFLPDPICDPSTGNYKMPTEWKTPEFYKEQLQERLYLLPPKGVQVLCKNCKDIVAVLMREKYMEDNIFLLYKLAFYDGTYASGFYDTKRQIFYSPWAFSSGEDLIHKKLEGFILQNYLHLTNEVNIDVKRIYALKVVDQIESFTNHHELQPVVQYLSLNPKYTQDNNKEKKFITFDKTKYKATLIDMNPQIRNLPKGYKASDEALKLARELGYTIQEGQTFVRPFKKKVHQLDKDVENSIEFKK